MAMHRWPPMLPRQRRQAQQSSSCSDASPNLHPGAHQLSYTTQALRRPRKCPWRRRSKNDCCVNRSHFLAEMATEHERTEKGACLLPTCAKRRDGEELPLAEASLKATVSFEWKLICAFAGTFLFECFGHHCHVMCSRNTTCLRVRRWRF